MVLNLHQRTDMIPSKTIGALLVVHPPELIQKHMKALSS